MNTMMIRFLCRLLIFSSLLASSHGPMNELKILNVNYLFLFCILENLIIEAHICAHIHTHMFSICMHHKIVLIWFGNGHQND